MYKILFRLVPFVRPYFRMEIVLLLLLTCSTLASLVSPIILKQIIDKVFPTRNFSYLIELLGILTAVYLFRIIVNFLLEKTSSYISNRIVKDIRLSLFDHLLKAPVAFFNQTRSGDLMYRLNNDVSTIEKCLSGNLIKGLSNIIFIVVVISILLVLNLRLMMIIAVVFPLILVNYLYFQSKIKVKYAQIKEGESAFTSNFMQAIQNILVIKSFNAYKWEVGKANKQLEIYNEKQSELVRMMSTSGSISSFLVALSPLIIFGVGGYDVLFGSMSLGSLVAFVQYVNRLFGPSRELMKLNSELVKCSVSTKRVIEILDTKTEFDTRQIELVSDGLNSLRFNNVSLVQGQKLIIKCANFKLEKGNVYALIGASGSGKTSIINLICKFISPTSGQIFVDDTDLETIDAISWRNNLSIVNQDSHLFHDTLYNNIVYNSDVKEKNEFAEVVRASNLTDYIDTLPLGVNTMINQQGWSLSGGQKQRITIARALLRKAEIIMLDESTSGVDSVAEEKIYTEITSRFPNKIILIITHRVNALKFAQKTISIDKGVVTVTDNYMENIEDAVKI